MRSNPAAVARALLATILTGCGQGQSPGDPEFMLVVTVTMSGLLPSRTVQVIVNDSMPLAVEGPNTGAPLVARGVAHLPTGSYRVRITGLDPNCLEPAPREVWMGGHVPSMIVFQVECRDDQVLAGRGLSWINRGDDAWGNTPLSILQEDGQVIYPDAGYYAADAVWSDQGDALAVLRNDVPSVILLKPDGSLLPFAGFNLPTTVAIAWVPGQFVLSLLDLSQDACRVLLLLPSAASADQTIACGAPVATASPYGGDISWSPDGINLAVAVGLEPAIRLVNSETGAIVKRLLPGGLVPGPIEWSSDGAALFVLANCADACSAGNLVLLRHEPVSGSWDTMTSWSTETMTRVTQTLELLDPGHLAVGLIEANIHVVSLDAPDQSRVFLPQVGYRLSRRP